MAKKFPDIPDLPDDLDQGVHDVLSPMKEIIETHMSRRGTDYEPDELYEPANKRYVDRKIELVERDTFGSNPDFTQADLTMDAAYHYLDCSHIVPAGARAIIFNVWVKDSSASILLYLKRGVGSGVWNVLGARTQVADIYSYTQGIVFCEPDRRIYYYASASFDNINLSIPGWFV